MAKYPHILPSNGRLCETITIVKSAVKSNEDLTAEAFAALSHYETVLIADETGKVLRSMSIPATRMLVIDELAPYVVSVCEALQDVAFLYKETTSKEEFITAAVEAANILYAEDV